jgi:hypothetical protein
MYRLGALEPYSAYHYRSKDRKIYVKSASATKDHRDQQTTG